MTDTPRMNSAAGVPTRNWEAVAERVYDMGCELERENAAMRAAFHDIHETAHLIAKAGPLLTPTLAEAWGKFMRISAMATAAMPRPADAP